MMPETKWTARGLEDYKYFSYRLIFQELAVGIDLTRLALATVLMGGLLMNAAAQGVRPSQLGASNLEIGKPGIAWYTTWESAQAEAARSGRPIMFVAAATQCHGVSGVF
jgi:hypothetical protein